MALVIIILCFAFKIGEIKGMMEQAYGHGFMDGNFRYGRGNMMLYGGANQDGNWQVTMPMMNWQETNTTTPATKSTTATPTKK